MLLHSREPGDRAEPDQEPRAVSNQGVDELLRAGAGAASRLSLRDRLDIAFGDAESYRRPPGDPADSREDRPRIPLEGLAEFGALFRLPPLGVALLLGSSERRLLEVLQVLLVDDEQAGDGRAVRRQ